MIDIFKMILWLAATIAVGWSTLSVVFFKKRALFLGEKLALGYGMGLGIITLRMGRIAYFGERFSAFSILIVWLPLVLIALVLDYQNRRPAIPYDERIKPSILERCMAFGIAFEVIYALARALIKPIEAYDAMAIYGLQAKIFYLAKGIPPGYFTSFKGFVPHIEYPPLLAFSETYFYTFLGALNDCLVKIIFPLFYLSILIVLYSVLRRIVERKVALLFTFLLATIPQFAEYATNGYADMLLAFYCSAGLFYLFLWMREKEAGFLIISFMLSFLGLWTKTEGLMLFGVNLIIAAAYGVSSAPKAEARKVIVYFLISLMAIGAYLSSRTAVGLPIHGDFAVVGRPFGHSQLVTAFKRIPAIAYEYQRQFFGPKKWNIVWILFLGMLVINFKKAFSGDLKFLTLAILGIFCGYGAVYLALPGDISWHLSTTGSRFFIHFVPIVVLWLGVMFKEGGLEI